VQYEQNIADLERQLNDREATGVSGGVEAKVHRLGLEVDKLRRRLALNSDDTDDLDLVPEREGNVRSSHTSRQGRSRSMDTRLRSAVRSRSVGGGMARRRGLSVDRHTPTASDRHTPTASDRHTHTASDRHTHAASDLQVVYTKLESTNKQLSATRELLRVKCEELEELRTAHTRRLDRLRSLQASYRLLKKNLQLLEEEGRRSGSLVLVQVH
jgi:hypothetical protein